VLYKDGLKLRPKGVGGINKHRATVGIKYCRCNIGNILLETYLKKANRKTKDTLDG
jgi:hypothetical protein